MENKGTPGAQSPRSSTMALVLLVGAILLALLLSLMLLRKPAVAPPTLAPSPTPSPTPPGAPPLSSSDTLESIEQDLQATDLEHLDEGLSDMGGEL